MTTNMLPIEDINSTYIRAEAAKHGITEARYIAEAAEFAELPVLLALLARLIIDADCTA